MLGREGDAPFAFPEDRKLSARHVRIESAVPGLWRAVDLNSRNGLWINDRRVTERWLVHGDRIHVGSQDFLFHDGTAETGPWTGSAGAADRGFAELANSGQSEG